MVEIKKSFQTPFTIGDDLLYMVPDLFYVEEHSSKNSYCSFMIDVTDFFQKWRLNVYDSAVSDVYVLENLGNTLFINQITGHHESEKIFALYKPADKKTIITPVEFAYARYDRWRMTFSDAAPENTNYWENFFKTHPTGDLLIKLYSGKYNENRKEILEYVFEQVAKDQVLKEGLLQELNVDNVGPRNSKPFEQFSPENTLEDYIKINLARF